MSVLPSTSEQSRYAEFAEAEDESDHKCDESSDGGTASNSDAEPELEESDTDFETDSSDLKLMCQKPWAMFQEMILYLAVNGSGLHQTSVMSQMKSCHVNVH